MRYIYINKVVQEGLELCWAAAIEMVYQHYHTPTDISQNAMKVLKNSWTGTTVSSMESEKNYYLRLFTNSLLSNKQSPDDLLSPRQLALLHKISENPKKGWPNMIGRKDLAAAWNEIAAL